MNIELFDLDNKSSYYEQLEESLFRVRKSSPTLQSEYGLLLHPEMYNRIVDNLHNRYQTIYDPELDRSKISTSYGVLKMFRSFDIDVTHYKIFPL